MIANQRMMTFASKPLQVGEVPTHVRHQQVIARAGQKTLDAVVQSHVTLETLRMLIA